MESATNSFTKNNHYSFHGNKIMSYRTLPFNFLMSLFACVVLSMMALCDEPNTKIIVPQDELTPSAEAIEKELRAKFPAGSEAIVMLEGILDGSYLNPEGGWFKTSKSQNRFGWDYVRDRFDSNQDSKVSESEFTGSSEDFSRLDRNEDHQLTEADFDWSKHSLTPLPGFMMFFMADRDANGKLSREEFLSLFEQLGADKDGYLAMDDLRERFIPAPPSDRDKRPDKPSRSTLIQALKSQELGGLESGPNLDDSAPDFTLTTLDGKQVTLSKEVGEKPIVLIFGNFTCGPFRSQAGNIEKLYHRYQERAKFFLVYVREAHPSDGWWSMSNQRVGIDVLQPKTIFDRRTIATKCRNHLDLEIPFLVDGVDDVVGAKYCGMPNRLYLVDEEGKIAFKNGRGPFGFHPRQLEQALLLQLNK
jgi:Ca2+-binding EF-hand superfamily protein